MTGMKKRIGALMRAAIGLERTREIVQRTDVGVAVVDAIRVDRSVVEPPAGPVTDPNRLRQESDLFCRYGTCPRDDGVGVDGVGLFLQNLTDQP